METNHVADRQRRANPFDFCFAWAARVVAVSSGLADAHGQAFESRIGSPITEFAPSDFDRETGKALNHELCGQPACQLVPQATMRTC